MSAEQMSMLAKTQVAQQEPMLKEGMKKNVYYIYNAASLKEVKTYVKALSDIKASDFFDFYFEARREGLKELGSKLGDAITELVKGE